MLPQEVNFNTYPGKSQIFLWYRNFQSCGTVNKRSKKSEMPSSGKKLSARSADNVEASRVSVGRSSLIVWLAGGVIQNGRHIRLTWVPQTSTVGIVKRQSLSE